MEENIIKENVKAKYKNISQRQLINLCKSSIGIKLILLKIIPLKINVKYCITILSYDQ